MLTMPDIALVVLVTVAMMGIICIGYSYMIRRDQLGWVIRHTDNHPHEAFLEALTASAPRYNVKVLTIIDEDALKKQAYLRGLAADCKLLKDDLALQGYWVTLQAI